MSLEEVRPASASTRAIEVKKPFSIGSRVFKRAIKMDVSLKELDAFLVYDVSGYDRFEAWFGIPDVVFGDKKTYTTNRRFRVLLDGREALSGTLSQGDPPVHADVELEGAKSLRVEVSGSVHIAEGTLSSGGASVNRSAVLVAPKGDAVVSGSSVALVWNAIPGADGYGIEVVCTKPSGTPSAAATRMWAHHVTGGATRFDLDLSDKPSGTYRWRVIGFTPTGVSGKFSADGVFVVSPK
jgi:hypothetical protein